MYISPDIILKLHVGYGRMGNKIDRLPDRVFVSDDLAPIVVGANQEHRITLDLGQVFDLNAWGVYTFRFKVKGFEPGNDCEFSFNPTDRPDRNDSEEPNRAEARITAVYKTQFVLWPALGIIVTLGFLRLCRRKARR